MPRFLAFSLLVALIACLPASLKAQETAGLYEGVVAVSSQDQAQREAALPVALAQVLVKVSGDSEAGALANGVAASSLVSQYRYRQGVEVVEGMPQLRSHLVAQFDQVAVARLLASAGRTTWPAPRPAPLLLLAIDDGSGFRLLTSANAGAVPALGMAAERRGIGLRYPDYGPDEQAVLRATDLAAEETYAADSMGQRYGGSLLMGELRRGGAGWQARWRLREGGQMLGDWRAEDADSSRVLTAGVNGAADILARRYTQLVLSGPAGQYPVLVEGIGSAEDFARALRTLRAQPIVRDVRVTSASGHRLELELDLSAGIEGLARLLDGGRVLRSKEPSSDGTMVFVLSR